MNVEFKVPTSLMYAIMKFVTGTGCQCGPGSRLQNAETNSVGICLSYSRLPLFFCIYSKKDDSSKKTIKRRNTHLPYAGRSNFLGTRQMQTSDLIKVSI